MPFLLNASSDKNVLRRLARQRRRGLDCALRTLACQRVADHLAQRIADHGWRRIAAYLAVASELDLAPLFDRLPGVELALPVIDDDGVMHFRLWQPGDDLVAGPYAIPQPAAHAAEIRPATLDAVLLPLLGFDRRGVRLGSGAGYYDRCFAFRQSARAPVLIGVAFAAQEFDVLPADAWDVRLDAVVTEQGWLDCSG